MFTVSQPRGTIYLNMDPVVYFAKIFCETLGVLQAHALQGSRKGLKGKYLSINLGLTPSP